MNEERSLRAGLLLPSQKFGLIRVGRKPVDRVDVSQNRDPFVENVDLLGAIDDAACQGAAGGVPDENHARLRVAQIVPEMVPYATAGTHARACHDDGA